MQLEDLALDPEAGVERRDGRYVAIGDEPWLRLAGCDLRRFAGRFVELTYRASFWDEPVRPVLRMARADGSVVDHVAAGPIVGTGLWIGRVPRDIRSLSVSPTHRLGPFDFAIESLRVRHWPGLIADGLRRNRRSTRSAVLTRLIGWGPESDNNLAWAIGATPMARFDGWRARRTRPLDLDGMERPRFDWTTAAPVLVVIPGASGATDALRRTGDSLLAQVFPRWRLLLCGGAAASGDERIVSTTPEQAETLLADAADGTLVAAISPGDRLLPEALACLVEQAHRHPNRRLFYGDAIVRGNDGRERPLLLPGWSPRLQATRPYLRAPVFLRDPARWSRDDRQRFLEDGALPDAVAALAPDAVLPLRRFLVETVDERPKPPAPRPCSRVIAPTASIIIPTRDHPALLRRAIAAIRRTTGARGCEIVVVDNGSTTPEAKALLATLRSDPDSLVLDRPGPFNFSKLCNEAAGAARGDVLVFLNDDTEVQSADWLDRLCAHAIDPATGAVGARLTYPDGRLQHVGVLLGMGGSAGHFGAPAPGDDPGWADRNLAVHEVSAVTGACLAVARGKLAAVGGFDEVHLPIELSDIDLCLKLNARGWQTIVDPAVHIMHEESASRGGATLRRLAVHDAERAIFLSRWRRVLRDDPVFHPGLSLYSWRAALG